MRDHLGRHIDGVPRVRQSPVGGTVPGLAHRTRRLADLASLLGGVGPAAFIVLVSLLGILWDGYDPIRDTMSELGAVDSPYARLMNVGGFMGVGVSILAFCLAYALLLRPSWAKTIAVGLLAITGVGLIVVGFFPCDAGCIDVTETGRLHSVFSMPGAIGLPAASMLSAAAFRTDGRFGPVWQVTSFWLGLFAIATGPVVAAELLVGADGFVQRVGMWSSLAWMAAVSWNLRAIARGRTIPPRHGPSSLG